MITECCVCRDYKDPETNRYYTPSPEQRRIDFFNKEKKSHGYCPVCFIINMRYEGIGEEK